MAQFHLAVFILREELGLAGVFHLDDVVAGRALHRGLGHFALLEAGDGRAQTARVDGGRLPVEDAADVLGTFVKRLFRGELRKGGALVDLVDQILGFGFRLHEDVADADFRVAPTLGFLVVFGLDRFFLDGIVLQELVDGLLHKDHVGGAGDLFLNGRILVKTLLAGIAAHDLRFDDHVLDLLFNGAVHHGLMGVPRVGEHFRGDGFLLSLGHEFAVDREVLEFGHGGARGESEGEGGGNRSLDHFVVTCLLLWGTNGCLRSRSTSMETVYITQKLRQPYRSF